MRTRLAKPLLLAALAAAIPFSAASAEGNHPIHVKVKSMTVDRAGGYAIDAGRVTGNGGEGAALIGTKTAGGHKIDTKVKIFYRSGEQRLSGIIVYKLDAQGAETFTLTGRLHFTGGSGRFRGISGNVRFVGHVDKHEALTARLNGSASY
jgi:hypothetical protein